MADGSAAELATGVRTITESAETYAAYSAHARQSFDERFTAASFERGMASLFEAAAD